MEIHNLKCLGSDRKVIETDINQNVELETNKVIHFSAVLLINHAVFVMKFPQKVQQINLQPISEQPKPESRLDTNHTSKGSPAVANVLENQQKSRSEFGRKEAKTQ